jgi:Protein of unknown function DUF262/Protein of unknown function (DUF1524)
MKSETIAVQQIFQDRRQYRVPFYQRAYVWNREEQWEPLWNDICDKAEVRSGGDTPTPHFLGAIVLEPQSRRGLLGVETYHIIDGQQRLTTLQYFLVALVIEIKERHDGSGLISLVNGCIWNPNPETMENAEIERFKVWPTFRDRANYQSAMESISRDDLRDRFPASFTQSGSLRKVGIDHPPALEAIWYFCNAIDEWIEGDGQGNGGTIEQLMEAVLRDLKLVSISLDESDDAQVIFETLNGRGAELHATDLIRNFIFMRADREGIDGSTLYDTLWSPFEGPLWTEPLRRGRLRKPRLEWFVQTVLHAELADDVDIGKVYAEYRKFAVGGKTPVSAEMQLHLLTKHADHYQQLTSGSGTDPIARYGKRLAVWDASPTHGLALRIAASGLSSEEQSQLFDDIMSYLVRRAMCGLPPKNYNKVFVQLLKRFADKDMEPPAFRMALASLQGSASRWPKDDEFRLAWLNERAISRFGDVARVRAMLVEIENAIRTERTEEPFVPSAGSLDVDHVLPDKWYEHWDLNGAHITPQEASAAVMESLTNAEPSEHSAAIMRREKLKDTFGNLTLVHYGVNRSLQHCPFAQKRDRLFAESNLHLNRKLMIASNWDEATILERGNQLFEIARHIWRGPEEE